jgi:hypothetical protein
MKKGEIDAISNLDPVIAKLEADGDAVALIDTRTEAGTKALFGGTNPAACLYAKGDFIDKNPETCQRLVNAFMKALKWMANGLAGRDGRLGAGGIFPRRQGGLSQVAERGARRLFAERRDQRGGPQVDHGHAGQARQGTGGREHSPSKTFVDTFVAKAAG